MAQEQQQNPKQDGNTNAQGKRKPGWMSIKGGPKEPNFQDFHGQLQKLSAEKSTSFEKLTEIREQLDGQRNDEDDSVKQERRRLQDRMKEIREERKKLNGMKEDKFSERQGLQNERKALQRQIQDFSEELSGFDSLEAIEGAINRVLIHMETGSGSLKSEKKTLMRVNQLEKAKSMVQQLRLLEERNQDAANEDRELGQEYTKIRSDMENLDKQFKSVAGEKDAAQKLEKKSFGDRDALREKRTGIRAEIDEVNVKITELRAKFDEGKVVWNKWREEAQKIWQAERDAQQKEWEIKKAARDAQYKADKKAAKALKRLNPYAKEIDACSALIRFLNDKAANHLADKERIEREKKLAAFSAEATAPKGFTVAGAQEEESWLMGKPKKVQKQKAPKAKKVEEAPAKSKSNDQPREKLISFSSDRRTSFDLVKVDTPTSYAGIKDVVETLKAKKAEYETHIKDAPSDEDESEEDEAKEEEVKEEAAAEEEAKEEEKKVEEVAAAEDKAEEKKVEEVAAEEKEEAKE